MIRRISLRSACAMVVSLLFASCSQEELAEQSTVLPDGQYPMTFAAVQTTPQSDVLQTRVSENNPTDSRWDGGEKIKVTVRGTGNNMETTCTLNASGNITDYSPMLYWQNTNPATINAWYSNLSEQATVTSETVSLGDQSSKIVYVLKADQIDNANYRSGNIQLRFRHQLAKVRVNLRPGSYMGGLSNATVKVKGYTSCTVTDGTVSNGSEEGYIQMYKIGNYYEANLVPGTLQASEAFEISANGKSTKVNLTDAVRLNAGNVHTQTIIVNRLQPLYVKLDTISTTEYTFTRDGTLDGSSATPMNNNKTIYVNDGVTLTLKNVGIAFSPYDPKPFALCCKGDATIILEGNNYLRSRRHYPGLYAAGNLTIKGSGSLNAVGGEGAPGIGGVKEHNLRSGDIVIEGGNISAIGNAGHFATSGVGLGGECGNIIISAGRIYAQGAYDCPAIGSYRGSQCGNITITGGNFVLRKGIDASSHVGAGPGGTCGTVTIDENNAEILRI